MNAAKSMVYDDQGYMDRAVKYKGFSFRGYTTRNMFYCKKL